VLKFDVVPLDHLLISDYLTTLLQLQQLFSVLQSEGVYGHCRAGVEPDSCNEHAREYLL
jgi:hypothetical protein